jgi:diguanylate cyclase (GGDEF)-like protein
LDELARMRTEVGRLSAEVRTDALTGLFNYRHFNELLGQEVERSLRSGLPLALIMADLDRFKGLNDRWGHDAGNRVLCHVADILRAGVRRIDAVCRFGGEEMALLLPGTTLVRAVQVAERLRAQLADLPVPLGARQVPVTASFGVAVFPGPGVANAADLLRQADAALYRAKAAGRNRVAQPEVPDALSETQVSADEKRALLD